MMQAEIISRFPTKLVHPLLWDRHFHKEMVMTTWAIEEFAGADLGDARLNRRLAKLAATLADKPTARIP